MKKFKFSIGRKIGLGFGVLIFLTLGAFILTQQTSKKSKQINDDINDIYSPSVTSLQQLKLLLVTSKGLINNWIWDASGSDKAEKKELRILMDDIFPTQQKQLQGISYKWKDAERVQLDSVFLSIDSLFRMYCDVMIQLNKIEDYNADNTLVVFQSRESVTEGPIFSSTNRTLSNLENIIATQKNYANSVSEEMNKSLNFLQLVVLILTVALPVGGILIAFFTVISIVRPIDSLKKILLGMGKGVLPTEKIQNRNDEIGEMSTALNFLVDGMRSTTEFANQVGSGNFVSKYIPLSDEDALGQALLKMRTDLAENERFLEAKVIERTEEVVKQKEEIQSKTQILEVLYKQVTDSIFYAKRIQEAILPPRNLVRKLLPNSFILYKPKDIVSGDFYWMEEKDGKTLFAAVDCTGHGVPGAFMSIVGFNILKYVVNNNGITEPAKILDALNIGVNETLHQSYKGSTSKDGMDITLCAIDYKKKELQYAGAFNPLFIIREGKLMEIKADKFPIGYYVGEDAKPYTNHVIPLQSGDCVYIFSDGYADQFGGPRGKKFMVNQFRRKLMELHQLSVDEQKSTLDSIIEKWRGEQEQVDDILVIGFKVD